MENRANFFMENKTERPTFAADFKDNGLMLPVNIRSMYNKKKYKREL